MMTVMESLTDDGQYITVSVDEFFIHYIAHFPFLYIAHLGTV